jgi:hypothetical protein
VTSFAGIYAMLYRNSKIIVHMLIPQRASSVTWSLVVRSDEFLVPVLKRILSQKWKSLIPLYQACSVR